MSWLNPHSAGVSSLIPPKMTYFRCEEKGGVPITGASRPQLQTDLPGSYPPKPAGAAGLLRWTTKATAVATRALMAEFFALEQKIPWCSLNDPRTPVKYCPFPPWRGKVGMGGRGRDGRREPMPGFTPTPALPRRGGGSLAVPALRSIT
jgi:hypothetical protein